MLVTRLVELRLDPVPPTVTAAARRVASLLEAICRDAIAIDPWALRDLLAYTLAAFEVGREPLVALPAPAADIAEILDHEPRGVLVGEVAPFRLLRTRTPLERLVDGQLTPCRHEATHHLLLSKVAAPGAPAFYTRRSFAIESFELDATAAELLPLCAPGLDVAAIGHRVAARLDRPPTTTLATCAQALAELARAGVVELSIAR